MKSIYHRDGFSRFFLRTYLGVVFLAAVFVLSVGSFFDLQLAIKLLEKDSLLGELISKYGEWPGVFTAISSFLIILVLRFTKKKKRYKKLKRFLPLAYGLLILTLLHPVLIVQVLKYLWGRRRFDHLEISRLFKGALPRDIGYTPFYLPVGIGEGRSFPSGHVAISSIFILWPFDALLRRSSTEVWIGFLLSLGYAFLVAYGRMILGRHFLCDTLFSIFVPLIISPLLVNYFHKRLARLD